MSLCRHSKSPFVYFIRRADGEGPVKIGCSQEPQNRLLALTAWSPYVLAIVASIPGDEALERRFHARFSAQHSHREWFSPSPELTLVMAQVAAGEFDVSTLPTPKRLHGGAPRPRWTEEARLNASNSHRLARLRRHGVHLPDEFTQLLWGRYQRDEADRMRATQTVARWIDSAEKGAI